MMRSDIKMGNIKRILREQGIYMMTMSMIFALMFAFNSMLFSKSLRQMSQMFGVLSVILLAATALVVCMAAWLIQYMVSFYFRRRSNEFAIYLVLGMKKREISHVYFKEHLSMNGAAFVVGIILGIFVRQLLTIVFYSMMQVDGNISMEGGIPGLVMTSACFVLCHGAALFMNHRSLKKMSIRQLLQWEKRNESLSEKMEQYQSALFWGAFLYLLLFFCYSIGGNVTLKGIFMGSAGAVICLYACFTGMSARLSRYVRKKKTGVYRGMNVFLLRQLSSKIRTMRMTMGNLCLLFACALVGMSAAFMLNDWQNQQLEECFPFDVSIHREDAGCTFEKEKDLIESMSGIAAAHSYEIYEGRTTQWNDYFYTHLPVFGNEYEGQKNIFPEGYDQKYYRYDTYIKLSDYNELRRMLGYETVTLSDSGYLIQAKERLLPYLEEAKQEKTVVMGKTLTCEGYRTEPFCQNGHNGADYLIVVPDWLAEEMEPYYSQLAVMTVNPAGEKLQEKLEEMNSHGGIEAVGTDLLSYSGDTFVKDAAVFQMKSTLLMLYFPLMYIGFVFLCISLAILSAQQLSNAPMYGSQYGILQQLGANSRELNGLLFWQQALFYLTPAVLAAILGGAVTAALSRKFILNTGLKTAPLQYFGFSAGFCLSIYLLYFAITILCLKRMITARSSTVW